MSFADLGISKAVVRALAERDITQPFPVQQLVIRDALAGHDLLVQSPTGSGKTLAFGIPLVDLVEPDAKRPSALVLAPTRELASQIVDELDGDRPRPQPAHRRRLRRRRLRPPGQGRPARQHHRRHPGPARGPDRPRRDQPAQRQACSSSTRPTACSTWASSPPSAASSARPRPSARRSSSRRRSRARPASSPPPTPAIRATTPTPPPSDHEAEIEHRFVHVDSQAAKLDHLAGELRGPDGGRTLVFVRTKRGADRLVKRLRSRELEAVAMHGDKSQGQRERALSRFERGDVEVLVATDVAARGIDVADIAHVINFDAPGDRDSYVHRVGRTGRAGAPRRRHQLRADRPGRRDAPHRPRPRPERGVRAEPRPRRQGRTVIEWKFKLRPEARFRIRVRAAFAAPAPQPPTQGVRMSAATAAATKWTCEGCGVSAGQHRRQAGVDCRAPGSARPRAPTAWSADEIAPPRRRSTRSLATARSPSGQSAARGADRVRGQPHAGPHRRDHRPRLPNLGLRGHPRPTPARASRPAAHLGGVAG